MTEPTTTTPPAGPLPGEAVPCPCCGRRIGFNRWRSLATHCGMDGFRCPGTGKKVSTDAAA